MEHFFSKLCGSPVTCYDDVEVVDVNLYYQSADLFINPVANDTGVKTKLIEAIANHCTAISTESGAQGINKTLCGDKLVTVADHDWDSFANKIIEHCIRVKTETPLAFFDHYNWKNIAAKAAEKIKALMTDEISS